MSNHGLGDITETDLGDTKRIITWKDADQNLCALAASILDKASGALRTTDIQTLPFQDTNGVNVPAGIAHQTERGFWSLGWTEFEVTQTAVFETDSFSPDSHLYSALCWYSFQNLVRLRLAHARAELKKNLFDQSKGLRQDDTASRNPKGRKKWTSKFRREKERPA